ncbi:hypothetical protein MTO96_021950 [Rhipicephalus appendiculatus]
MSVAIKTEPGSPGPGPPTMPPCDIIHKPEGNIKIEPGSPPAILHSGFSGVDIKVERSSSPTTLAIDPLIIDIKGPFELPVPLLRIASVTTLKRSSNTSGGKDSLGSNKGVSVGPTGSSQKKSGSNKGASNECDVCGRRFANKNYVRQHLLTHKGKKSHSCFVCGRGFNYKITLRRHEETHCVKAYTCLVCDQKFAEESDFVEHQLVHMSAEMYTCRMCASKFCTREALERHERVHASGVDMCVCEECGMTFEQTAALERHLKLHAMKEAPAGHVHKDQEALLVPPVPCHVRKAAQSGKTRGNARGQKAATVSRVLENVLRVIQTS